jgi:hypothetical protein
MAARRFSFLLLIMWSMADGARSAPPCADFEARLPNVKRELCEAAQSKPSTARSVKGRMLWVRVV